MKSGDSVAYTSRHGKPMTGTVLRVDHRRPLRKAGVRLGSWTDNFYKAMALVKFKHANGKQGTGWVLMSRLTVKK